MFDDHLTIKDFFQAVHSVQALELIWSYVFICWTGTKCDKTFIFPIFPYDWMPPQELSSSPVASNSDMLLNGVSFLRPFNRKPSRFRTGEFSYLFSLIFCARILLRLWIFAVMFMFFLFYFDYARFSEVLMIFFLIFFCLVLFAVLLLLLWISYGTNCMLNE